MSLDPEFKKKWLEALRSGRYKKASGRLRSGDRFCCLGVACDLINPEGWQDDGGKTADYQWSGQSTWETIQPGSLLPESVLGLCKADQRSLSTMNDNGDSFKAIADVIDSRF